MKISKELEEKLIKSVYDNNGKTFDRYFVIFKGYEMGLSLSENCDSPQGVSMFSEFTEGSHLGKKIKFDTLPENVQNHILERME